jgi:hypothetical protein
MLGAMVLFLAAASGGTRLTEADLHGLQLALRSPVDVLVGQPTKATVTLSTTRDLEVGESGLCILMDSGGGFHQFTGARVSVMELVEGSNLLERGKPRTRAFVLGVSGGRDEAQDLHFAFAFPKPGRYKLVAEYAGLVRSNEVTVTVTAPKGTEAELFSKHLQPRPELLTTHGLEARNRPVLEKLLLDYTSRRHLAEPQLMLWVRGIGDRLGVPAAAGELKQLIGQIETTSWPDNPFDEDRLGLAADTYARIGEAENAARVYAELVQKYPDGAPAAEARIWLTQNYRDGDKDCPDHNGDRRGAHDCRDWGRNRHDSR